MNTAVDAQAVKPRSKLRRNLAIGGAVVVGLFIVVYFGIGYVIYNQLSTVTNKCQASFLAEAVAYTPADFGNKLIKDVTAYEDPVFQEVTFPARDDATITIDAFFVPAIGVDNPKDAPTVMDVHGLNSCKRDEIMMLSAGMLSHNGFNVLIPDLRDHGDSTVEDGRASIGMREYKDVLGGFDYLVNVQGLNPDKIGIMGFSMGAATTSIAFGEEPRLKAMWLDSGFADVNQVIDAELARNGLPSFMKEGGLLISQVVGGVNLRQFSPLDEMSKVNGRPVFLTHGTADTRLSVQYTRDLAARLTELGQNVEVWIVDGTEHVQAINVYPDEYQTKLIAFFKNALG